MQGGGKGGCGAATTTQMETELPNMRKKASTSNLLPSRISRASKFCWRFSHSSELYASLSWKPGMERPVCFFQEGYSPKLDIGVTLFVSWRNSLKARMPEITPLERCGDIQVQNEETLGQHRADSDMRKATLSFHACSITAACTKSACHQTTSHLLEHHVARLKWKLAEALFVVVPFLFLQEVQSVLPATSKKGLRAKLHIGSGVMRVLETP